VNNLAISSVAIGLPLDGKKGTSALQPGSSKKVLFSGNEQIIIPNRALAVSDPIHFPVKSQSTLLIDIYLAQGQQGNFVTGHPGSRTTSWMSFGNWVGAKNLTDPSVMSVDHWYVQLLYSARQANARRYFISAVEAPLSPSARSFAIIGDSITDGRGSDTNANNRFVHPHIPYG
jgi:hypothetical protein